MRPNDVITLIHDPQMFMAYGATGSNSEIPASAMAPTLMSIEDATASRMGFEGATSAVMEMCVDNPREDVADLFDREALFTQAFGDVVGRL